MVSGGALGQYLYNRDKRYQCLLMGGSTILAVFPMLYLINTNRVGDPFFYIVSFLSGVIISANGPNVRSVLQVRIQYNILSVLRMQYNIYHHNLRLYDNYHRPIDTTQSFSPSLLLSYCLHSSHPLFSFSFI